MSTHHCSPFVFALKSSSVAAVLALTTMATTAPQASAAPGDILWSADIGSGGFLFAPPKVGPDGRVYVHTNTLFAFTAQGALLWSKPIGGQSVVGVGPDGHVYAANMNTIYAYDADGNLLWSFTENPAGQGVMAGPSVGPDGNIYAVSDADGLGAFSLTPHGDLRWNVPGFVNLQGVGMTEIQFGPGEFYFAEDVVPGCGGPTEGIVAINFDGGVRWCHGLGALTRPTAAPNGDAYIRTGPTLVAYTPNGDIDWTFDFPIPQSDFVGPGVGPDGTAYMFKNLTDLWAINPGGTEKWLVENVEGSGIYLRPVASPDNSVLVFGAQYAFGQNGQVIGFNPADGSRLWTTPISGSMAGIGAPAAFSPDSSLVYLTQYDSEATHLIAVATGAGSGGPRLAVSGTCPGAMTLNVDGATSGGNVAFIRAFGVGSIAVPPGNPCAGTRLGLNATAVLIQSVRADSRGRAAITGSVPPSACGHVFVQALDASTCTPTNVEGL